jgi:glucose-6-phosphate isomerase
VRSIGWLERLAPHAARNLDRRLSEVIAAEPDRFAATTLRVGPLMACFARQRIDAPAAAALLEVARERRVGDAIAALFEGEPVNRSENRPALHTALRSDQGASAIARAAHAQARAARERMAQQVDALRASGVTDIVNVGIGGSDLGPRLAMEALRELDPGRFRVHFLSTVDGHAASQLQRQLDPDRSAAVLVSKSFSTQETLLNAQVLREWMGTDDRFHAVTASDERARALGIAPERILPMWDWVGGRYSLWSAVGFSLAAALGMAAFERLLAGAAQMDEHVRRAPLESNLAVRHALVAIWNRNALGYDTHAVLPYDARLARLPAYLQQLVMESLGKSITQEGEPVSCATGPVIWGGSGTDVQHSFFQSLHQGTDTVPMDFIGVVRADHGWPAPHRTLLANLLAQAEAFANGAASTEPQRAYPGNRPSTMILLDALTPESLGALIALYEHSVFVQATLWGINPFDQWGVELGKRLASDLGTAFDSPEAATDPITRALFAELHQRAQSK